MGPFTKPEDSSNLVLKIEHGKKPELLGSAFISVGAATGPPPDASERRGPQDVVPMSYHSHTIEELEEFIHSLNGKGFVELGSLDGIAPVLAVTMGILYVGITFTAALKAPMYKLMP